MHLLPFSLTSLLFSFLLLQFFPFASISLLLFLSLFPLLFPSPPPPSSSLFPFLLSFLPFSLFLSFPSLCSFSRTDFHHSSLFPATTTNHHSRKQQPSSSSLINPTFAFSLSFSSPFSFLLPSLPHPQPLISPPSSPFPATTTNHHRLKQQPSSPSLINPTEDKRRKKGGWLDRGGRRVDGWIKRKREGRRVDGWIAEAG